MHYLNLFSINSFFIKFNLSVAKIFALNTTFKHLKVSVSLPYYITLVTIKYVWLVQFFLPFFFFFSFFWYLLSHSNFYWVILAWIFWHLWKIAWMLSHVKIAWMLQHSLHQQNVFGDALIRSLNFDPKSYFLLRQ